MSEVVSHNPATGEVIWRGKAASAQDVADAVARARRAFADWGSRSLDQRLVVVRQFKKLLEENAAQLAAMISEENGKPLWDAKAEVQTTIGKVDISITAYNERTGEKKGEANGVKQLLRHRAHGVLAVFGPYNFPMHIPNGHITPALIAGNTVVFKPSDYTPKSAEMYAEMWHKAGLPKDALIVVQGGRETGVALAGDDGIDGILFTGSSAVGTLLHKQLGGKPGKILALEMGGNNPLVAWDTPDVQAAATLMAQSAFLSGGQRCTCARRLIVPEGKAGDAMVEALVALAQKLTVGAATDNPEPFMGPIISNAEAEKLLAGQAKLESEGAKVLLRMTRPKPNLPFVTPAILDVTNIKNREDHEYFGPFLQVIRVKDFDAAIAEANRTRYGLSSALISQDPELFDRFVNEIHAGLINWNRPSCGSSSAAPFGGVGLSGNHRPSAYYAADYCAYPIATLASENIAALPMVGLKA